MTQSKGYARKEISSYISIISKMSKKCDYDGKK